MNDIGLIGLAVMGENLVLNIESRGYRVSVFNRTVSKVDDFLEGRAKGRSISGFHTIEEFVGSLSVPRKIILMVKAGSAVDDMIESLKPHLQKGDIIIDGGNSNYKDTNRRTKSLEDDGFLFIGTGVSGGELGALRGPSIMPGGSREAWPEVKKIFEDISAKYDGFPCTSWIGNAGAGHFVKMVHNGIEYSDMQIIAESYDILKKKRYDNSQISKIFRDWNRGKLQSYLIEITADIFEKKEDGRYVIDMIVDSAGQKGTGKWTAIESLDQGVPLNSITESVFARIFSSLAEQRENINKTYGSKTENPLSDFDIDIKDLESAVYVSKIISYAQGFELIRNASKENGWNINYSDVAAIWRSGCIIRSKFLDDIMKAFSKKDQNLLCDDFFSGEIRKYSGSLRRTVIFGLGNGIPMPVMSSALSYLDSMRSENLPANLIQAQRDYFGAHTYERKDRKRGEFFHTDWTGEGGNTSSTNYNV